RILEGSAHGAAHGKHQTVHHLLALFVCGMAGALRPSDSLPRNLQNARRPLWTLGNTMATNISEQPGMSNWQELASDLSADKQAFDMPWGKLMMWIFLLGDTFIFS